MQLATQRQRHPATILCFGLVCTLLNGCAGFAPPPVTPISDITQAAQSGQGNELIISQIQSSKTVYALRGSDFGRLAERGVEPPVLDLLQQRFFGEVELLTKRWYMEGLVGGPAAFYPQPVDLDSLDQGGNGMAPAPNLGRSSDLRRPPGVPDWVPPNPAPPNAGTISPQEVLEMTQRGDAAGEIAARVRRSHVQPLYAASTSGFSRTRTAAISGSLYAELARGGVAPDVLDALQESYLADHIDRSRQVYQDMKGSAPSMP